jgi:hypothetical protein
MKKLNISSKNIKVASQMSLIDKVIDNKSLGKAITPLTKDSKDLVLRMWKKLSKQLELSGDSQSIYNLLYRMIHSKIDPKILEMEIEKIALHTGIK